MAEESLMLVLIGALIGSASSILMTFVYDTVRTERDDKKTLRVNSKALVRELESTASILEANADKPTVTMTILPTSVFDSIVSSGKLVLFSEDIQMSLQFLYSSIKQNNGYSANLVGFITSQSQVRDLVFEQQRMIQQGLRDSVRKVIALLKQNY